MPYDDDLQGPKPLTKATCGENRFVALSNVLEFYITPGCTIEIKPRDAIVGLVRMDWTMEEFYAAGGTSTFVDRIASVLGIPASRIFVV